MNCSNCRCIGAGSWCLVKTSHPVVDIYLSVVAPPAMEAVANVLVCACLLRSLVVECDCACVLPGPSFQDQCSATMKNSTAQALRICDCSSVLFSFSANLSPGDCFPTLGPRALLYSGQCTHHCRGTSGTVSQFLFSNRRNGERERERETERHREREREREKVSTRGEATWGNATEHEEHSKQKLKPLTVMWRERQNLSGGAFWRAALKDQPSSAAFPSSHFQQLYDSIWCHLAAVAVGGHLFDTIL